MSDYTVESFSCGGRACWLATPKAPAGQALPLVVMPAGQEETAMLEELLAALAPALAKGEAKPIALAGFESEDWNRDYSPWPAPALFKKAGDFAGAAAETMEYILSVFIPEVEKRANLLPGRQHRGIMGYSLAGLFSLWAFYQSGAFGGCASCSGSLWYPGWEEYHQKQKAAGPARVYLSLGDSEEKAKNQQMARVGQATRQTARRLEADEAITETLLEWNPGGHFNGVPARLARALLWLAR